MDEEQKRLSRRAFLRGAGAKAFSTGSTLVPGLAAANAAMQKKAAAAGKAIDDPGLEREDITYDSGPDRVKATLFRKTNMVGTAPAVIVVHEIFGLTDHIRDVAARLAREGYIAIAPDLYSREGGAPDTTDIGVLRTFTANISDDRIVGDLQAAETYLSARPDVAGGKIGSVGFCMGGMYVLLFAAQTPSLDAGVVFYGRPILQETTPLKPNSPIDLIPRLQVPIQGHYGESDTSIPMADVDALKAALGQAGIPFGIYTYPDTPHAFHNDTRESYREQPAKLAWQRTLAFLEMHLKG